MKTWIALLRGINVGGKNRVPMADLRAVIEALGAQDVRTLGASGNVVFELVVEGGSPGLEASVSEGILARFGLRVPVVVRTRDELAALMASAPFAEPDQAPTAHHVFLMSRVPDPSAVEALDPDRSPPDRFSVSGREIFVHSPNGLGRSKLTVDWFERGLGVTVTQRNWRTMQSLQRMVG